MVLGSSLHWLSACAVTLALPVQMSAQDTATAPRVAPPEHLLQTSLGGGFSKVSSTPLSRTTHGFNLQAALAVRTPFSPLRLRLDGLFSDAGNTQVKAFTASAALAAPARWRVGPYLLAGGGGYIENSGRMTAGWNLGLGLNVPTGGQVLFIESRVHAYRDAFAGQPYVVPVGVVANTHEAYRYLWHPLTFGFRF
jgi:hypothetical protein